MKRTTLIACAGLILAPGIAWAQTTMPAPRREEAPRGNVAPREVAPRGETAPGGEVTGSIPGGIVASERPQFRTYVIGQHHPSFRYSSDVRVGAVLPDSGVTYYEVPSQFGQVRYRYTVVNDEVVLVDPGTHKIVEIIQ